MRDTLARAQLRRELEAHLTRLGYSVPRVKPAGPLAAEVARVHPVRSRIAYGATVLRSDLKRPNCHKHLIFFSQRRTRRRSSIPFFIAVAEADRVDLESLLEELGVRDGVRGGHVQIVSVSRPASRPAATPPAKAKTAASKPRAKAAPAKDSARKIAR
jgi:hypothetical protein